MKNKKIAKTKYRWFIWAIVFLVATGVSLVTWILSSGDTMGTYGTVAHRPVTVVHGRVVKAK